MVFFCIPCGVLVLYFLILAVFSPKYRKYVREGWRCFVDKLKGRKCSASFDNRMRIGFSMWLTKHGMPGIGKFFFVEKNFAWTLTIIGVVFTILSVYLFMLLMQFMFVQSPCDAGSICSVGL